MTDAARFYETQAMKYLDARDRSRVGTGIVQSWARSLPSGSTVVEIACGGGYPITRVLVDSGLTVWAVDSSPTLLRQFRLRFPAIPTQCTSALDSDYFGRTFDAVTSIGFLFLLRENEQADLSSSGIGDPEATRALSLHGPCRNGDLAGCHNRS